MDRGEEEELNMAQRYCDILTGLQYALVHLTGDYPVTEYSVVSQIVHLFGIAFGMCALASFTGIFVAGFLTYFKSERVVERQQAAEKRLNAVMFTVLLLQRKVRHIRERREARLLAAAAGVTTPVILLSEAEAMAREQARKKAILRTALRTIINRETPEGKRIMLVANIALLLNITGTMITSIPEVDENSMISKFCDFIEFSTGYVFLMEYSLHLAASPNWRTTFVAPMRLIDLFCLLPTTLRLWFVGTPHRWRQKNRTLEHVIDIAVMFRVIRVLDFPFVRRTRKKTFNAVATAFSGLCAPCVLAITVWVTSTSVFMWLEKMYEGPDKEHMETLPDALYWTSIYIIGEWANVDFSPGAGSRMCIFYCLFGVATFAVPVGLMMEAVESTLVTISEEHKQIQRLLSKSRTANLEEN